MKKKLLSALLCVAMVASLVVGCGGKEEAAEVPATEEAAESAIYYGKFIQNIVDFLIVAAVVFLMVKLINSFHKKKEEAPAAPPAPTAAEITNELLKENNELLKKMLEK